MAIPVTQKVAFYILIIEQKGKLRETMPIVKVQGFEELLWQ